MKQKGYSIAIPMYFKIFHRVKDFVWEDYGFSFLDKKDKRTSMTHEFCLANINYAIPLNSKFVNCKTDYYSILFPYIEGRFENLLIFKPEVLKRWIKENKDKCFKTKAKNQEYIVFKNNLDATNLSDYVINLRD